MLTYGDGVSDINIQKLLDFHQTHDKLVTITAVQPSGRFGALSISEENQVVDFREKQHGDGGWINGGFFVCEPKFFEYIENDNTILEKNLWSLWLVMRN